MGKKLKLFVWTDFASDYSQGLAFAIAETEEEARGKVIEALGYDTCYWGKLTVLPLNKKTAFAVRGGG